MREWCDVTIVPGRRETGPSGAMTRPINSADTWPNVMRGASRMPARIRRSSTPEASPLPGGLGITGEHGYVRIVGRRRATILRDGFVIHSRAMEDHLRAYPAVDDVCVIGVPHDMLGELMGACIVPVPSLVRVADVFPLTGNRRRKRRARERARALDHTAITGST